MTCPSFYATFRENMTALGLDAPASFFGTYQTAVGTLTLMLQPLATLGADATVAELIGATVGLEKLMVVGAMSTVLFRPPEVMQPGSRQWPYAPLSRARVAA